MPLYGFGILTLLAQLACAAHVVRTDRSCLWIIPIVILPWVGCAAYLAFAVLPDAIRGSHYARRIADDTVSVADPGTSYRRKKRDLETIGSAQSKRVFAEECIKRGRHQEAVELYESAMEGAHAEDPALLHGLARARLLAGDGAGAQLAFEALKSISPADFTADAGLDLARALELQGKTGEARTQYESLLPTYPGEEVRCRYALLLLESGEADKARRLFREIVDSTRGAPGYYRRRQSEWVNIAKRNLRG
ncbi:MAG TPA: tetratricopeptide repeat protein [Rhizomicrobium sp.]|jgi:hypothetical protein